MPDINTASDLLRPGEVALAIFTRGPHFDVKPDGTGASGRWRLAPDRHVDRMIIYRRGPDGLNEIYTADPAGLEGPNSDGRYTVLLDHVEQIGTTDRTWTDFTDAGTNPIRYLSRS